MRLVFLVPLALMLPLLSPAEAALPGPTPVAAVGFSFVSPVLKIAPGTTVEFKGVALPHTVTTASSLEAALAGNGNDEGNADQNADTFSRGLPVGASVLHTFNTPGTYFYHCEVHVQFGMVGEIIVG